MNVKLKSVITFILKNTAIMLVIFSMFLGGCNSDKGPDTPQLIEQYAIEIAEELLANKELFQEYQRSEPLDDSLFEEVLQSHLKNVAFKNLMKITLYSTSYTVKVSSYVNFFGKTEYVTCKAKVYSITSTFDDSLTATGLIFSEPITNKAANTGIMQKEYSSGYSIGVIMLYILLGIIVISVIFNFFFSYK